MSVFTQDDKAFLDYQVNWSAWLDTDTLSTSTFAAESGLSVSSLTTATTTATAWLTGGVKGRSYKVINSIVTAAGRKRSHTFSIRVE